MNPDPKKYPALAYALLDPELDASYVQARYLSVYGRHIIPNSDGTFERHCREELAELVRNELR